MKIKSYFIPVHTNCRIFQWCNMVWTMVLSSGNPFTFTFSLQETWSFGYEYKFQR